MFYEYGNELLGSKKGGEFLNQLSDYQLLQKDVVRGVSDHLI
jgi:hypothetical protein